MHLSASAQAGTRTSRDLGPPRRREPGVLMSRPGAETVEAGSERRMRRLRLARLRVGGTGGGGGVRPGPRERGVAV